MEKFIHGFKEDNLKVGLLSGQVELKNLVLNQAEINKVFQEANLPFRLKAGLIGKVSVKVILNSLELKKSILDFGVEPILRVFQTWDWWHPLYCGAQHQQRLLRLGLLRSYSIWCEWCRWKYVENVQKGGPKRKSWRRGHPIERSRIDSQTQRSQRKRWAISERIKVEAQRRKRKGQEWQIDLEGWSKQETDFYAPTRSLLSDLEFLCWRSNAN